MIWMDRAPTRICQRCKLHYKIDINACPHCSDLTERELVEFLFRRDEELNAIAGLGRVFLVLALLVVAFTFVAVSS